MEQNISHGNYMENFEDSIEQEIFPGAVERWTRQDNLFYFFSIQATLQVTVISDKVIRFRYGNWDMYEEDFSYAVVSSFQAKVEKMDIAEEEHQFVISTAQLNLYISKATLSTTLTNQAGLVLMEDEKGYHWQEEKRFGGDIVICTKKIQSGENFYGLGDKPTDLNLRGKRLQLWGSDTYGFGKETDPIYKNIPFFIGLHHKTAYGVFMDNTFRSFFDFGHERKNAYSFWAQGGEMNYYFIYGPEILEVSQTYTLLTGKPEMAPLWTLGYQQSKWSYYPEQVVRELAETFRSKKIPCDVIHLDIDYMDGFRCFTWNKDHFPDPAKMIKDLEKDGFKTIVIIDPGIKVDKDYWVYQEGLKHDYFCKRADGPLFKGSVWPGICNFPDFTDPKVREWWAGLFKGLMEAGVHGVWNDMNEPAVFEEGTFPFDVRHDFDGHPGSHRKGHNVYGMQMVRATYHGLKKFASEKRPFAISRSAYAGTQRYAAVWTGDNLATWEHLKIANVQCQRLSASGLSFTGSDIGGFIQSPDGELYTRWIQMAVFHPFFRTHSSGDHGDKEPWTFGQFYEDIVRKFIELRYRLLPYMYTVYRQYASEGIPMIRSLHMIDQTDPETYTRKEEFSLGEHVLVCPLSQKIHGRWLYLPKGSWYYFFNDKKYTDAGETWFDIPLDEMPLFIRAGAVIPFNPVMQYVGEKNVETLTLHTFFGQDQVESLLYADEGDGYSYQQGNYLESTFTTLGEENSAKLSQRQAGNFIPTYDRYKVIFHGLPFAPRTCEADGKAVLFEFTKEENLLTLFVTSNFKNIKVI